MQSLGLAPSVGATATRHRADAPGALAQEAPVAVGEWVTAHRGSPTGSGEASSLQIQRGVSACSSFSIECRLSVGACIDNVAHKTPYIHLELGVI